MSPQLFAFDILKHKVVGTNVVEMADVRVIQCSDRPRLAREALREFRRGDLDRNIAIEPRITGAIDRAHSSFPDLRDYFIWTQVRTWLEGHAGIIVVLA